MSPPPQALAPRPPIPRVPSSALSYTLRVPPEDRPGKPVSFPASGDTDAPSMRYGGGGWKLVWPPEEKLLESLLETPTALLWASARMLQRLSGDHTRRDVCPKLPLS